MSKKEIADDREEKEEEKVKKGVIIREKEGNKNNIENII